MFAVVRSRLEHDQISVKRSIDRGSVREAALNHGASARAHLVVVVA
jgi:hypothetical protein